jgi:hypothetical protein
VTKGPIREIKNRSGAKEIPLKTKIFLDNGLSNPYILFMANNKNHLNIPLTEEMK